MFLNFYTFEMKTLKSNIKVKYDIPITYESINHNV